MNFRYKADPNVDKGGVKKSKNLEDIISGSSQTSEFSGTILADSSGEVGCCCCITTVNISVRYGDTRSTEVIGSGKASGDKTGEKKELSISKNNAREMNSEDRG